MGGADDAHVPAPLEGLAGDDAGLGAATHNPPKRASSYGERLSERCRETREALKRAGPNPLRRYVLDLNVAAPGRKGAIETLDCGLTGQDSWSIAGSFVFVTLERALPADEGIDLSFFFDRRDGTIPSGVSHDLPAALLALAVLPAVAGVHLLGKNLLAWRRRRRPMALSPTPLPAGPEALSPETFAALFGEGVPLAPALDEVSLRLRDAKAIIVDRQGPPNLVLRADPAGLRPQEAVLVGLLFGDRGLLPLAEVRERARRLGGRLDEAVDEAFRREAQTWLGEGERLDAPRPTERDRDVAEAALAAFVLGLVPLAFWGGPLGTRIAGGIAVLAFSWLDPEPRRDVLPALFLSISAILVVRTGFVGARPGAKRKPSPLRAWALEQREALRERLMRGDGEVEPAEAPWFRAAGLEVSLAEPGVPEGDLEAVLGLSGGEERGAPWLAGASG